MRSSFCELHVTLVIIIGVFKVFSFDVNKLFIVNFKHFMNDFTAC